MQNNLDFFLRDIYSEHLAIIKGIHFTPREIDVIACLVSLRGTSKIASLLGISSYTVLTHTRNIMLKLECNSREGIIDFIERSHKLFFIKNCLLMQRLKKI
jgi:DNA-binding CsgD family transcriptional regulator